MPADERSASVDFELLGTLIGGKYRVREILGHGGMGTVFEAMHEGLGNLVAIKVLHHNQLHKKDAVQRFHHEARAAARIGHPNICEVHDVGSLSDKRPYLVMERLAGVTLAARIQSLGGLPVQEVIDTLTQVLSGLHAAHEKGIIHRDIKPENVFLSERIGCPPLAKLLDFGVSKVMTQHPMAIGFPDAEETRTGIVLGTPYYLAPEQARGERNLDARVDLYACGIMLYEALTGRRPFRAANYNALLIAILTSTPRPAREIRSDLPNGFGRILEKAMDRDPADRFQTALEFQAALQPYSQSPLARRSITPSRPPSRMPSGFPPAAPALVPSRVPSVPAPPIPRVDRTSTSDVQAFLRSDSGDSVVEVPPSRPAGRARATSPREAPSAPVGSAARATPHVADRHEKGSKKHNQNFDDQQTEVDLPRDFASEPSARAKSRAHPPGPPRPDASPAPAARHGAPIMGPPLRPPLNSPFADESATEIMSVAVRSKLPDSSKKRETGHPVVPRPTSPRTTPRR